MAPELESALERRFVRLVQAAGGMTSKLAPTDAGIPDRLVLMPGGRIHLVELKAEGGRLRPIQRVWHERAAHRGTEVIVLTGRAEIESWVDNEARATYP